MIRIGVGIVGLLDWVLKVRYDMFVFSNILIVRLPMHYYMNVYLHNHNNTYVAVEGPRIVRLAAVVDRGFKKGSCLDVNVFGAVTKSDF
jgi:hypothetical protein